jgi:hypothetical protein
VIASLARTKVTPNLSEAKLLGSRFGRVTSTLRSTARNRAVGGVRNSWHLSGRAIDIARAPGVRHAQIAAAYRAAGYQLIESLDEGDHSHLAFAAGSRNLTLAVSDVSESGPVLSALTFRAAPGSSVKSR